MQANTNPVLPMGIPEKTGFPERDSVIRGMPEKAVAGIETLSSGAHQAVDAMAAGMSAAARQLGDKGRDLLAAQHRLAEASRDTVRRHPIAAVAVALVAGVFLSRISGHLRH